MIESAQESVNQPISVILEWFSTLLQLLVQFGEIAV